MMRRSCKPTNGWPVIIFVVLLVAPMLLLSCSAYMTPSLRHVDTTSLSRQRHSIRHVAVTRNTPQLRRRRTTTTSLLASVLETNESPSFKPANETKQQQQFEQVLSSPDLLDPASILDATIGIVDAIDYSAPSSSSNNNDDNPTVQRIHFDDANTLGRSQNDFAISHDDDLDLTRQIIMQHIEQIGKNEEGNLNWILDDDDEDDDYDDDNVQSTTAKVAARVAATTTTTTTTEDTTTSVSISSSSPANLIENNTPTVFKILKYTIPAIGVWMCSPVLSMIDTASVGLLSGTAQQAALNPAVSVTDYGALVVAFMYTATTNLIAAAQAQDQDGGDGNAPRTTLTLVTALKLALIVGTVFGATLSVLGNTLIQSLIGNDSLDPNVMAAALRYVRIRCLGMPAALVIGTAQSACLGMQDVKSPLYVLLAAAIINFCGDVLLVPNANPWLGGAAGAAWATVFSQYGAMIMFWRWLTTRPREGTHGRKRQKFDRNFLSRFGGKRHGEIKKEKEDTSVVNVTQGIMELTGRSVEGKPRRKEFREFLASRNLLKGLRLQSSYEALKRAKEERRTSVKPIPKSRGFLADGKLNLRDYFSLSKIDLPTAKEFSPFVIPVTTTSIGRISGYIAMSHVASSTLGTFDMAAHQIIFSIFCCLTPIVDALSQVAQSFVPAIHGIKDRSVARANALQKTVNNFRKVGASFGLLLVSLVSIIPLISRYFTSDALVLQRVNGAIPGVAMFLIVNGLMCAGEGSLLGQKDLVFLRNMYAIFFFTVPAYMLRLKYRALAGLQNVGIGTMWAAFATYNVIRTSIWHIRLAHLQRRTYREVEEDS